MSNVWIVVVTNADTDEQDLFYFQNQQEAFEFIKADALRLALGSRLDGDDPWTNEEIEGFKEEIEREFADTISVYEVEDTMNWTTHEWDGTFTE